VYTDGAKLRLRAAYSQASGRCEHSHKAAGGCNIACANVYLHAIFIYNSAINVISFTSESEITRLLPGTYLCAMIVKLSNAPDFAFT
jgi:hypothetical protein